MGCSQGVVSEAHPVKGGEPTRKGSISRSRSAQQILPETQLPAGGPGRPEKAWTSEQHMLGPQSFRGDPTGKRTGRIRDAYVLGDSHRESCFKELAEREQELCKDWAVFYHSYWCAAVLYETQAALASLLFGFPALTSPLPRLLSRDFLQLPDASALRSLIPRFEKESPGKADHHPQFRRVAISTMCSLMSSGPEVCVAKTFEKGYSCKGLKYRDLLKSLLEACHVPADMVAELMAKIIQLSQDYGLDASVFGGKAAKDGKSGHLLQVFVRRDLVDSLCYASKPYGGEDGSRMPMSSWLSGDHSFSTGQARLLAHPAHFLQKDRVKTFVASADQDFHGKRRQFQEDLRKILEEGIDKGLLELAAQDVCPVVPPKDAAGFARNVQK